MWCGQCKETHIKFGVNMLKLCRGTASDVVWHHDIKFVDRVNENSLIYKLEFHVFCLFVLFLPAWSEYDLSQIW